MYVTQETRTDLDISVWFDSTFAQAETPPVKGNLFTNMHGVQILETTTSEEPGPLRYFFVSPSKTVISISFTTGNSVQTNSALQVIYGKILESISLLE